jgi:hypothetical protein
MMRRLAFGNLLSRLFGGEKPRMEFQIIVHLQADEPMDQDVLEEKAELALDCLHDHAGDTALGAAVGFDGDEIEIEFTVEASSMSEVHRQIGHVLQLLEKRGGFEFNDSTTSRVAHDPREPVLA